MRLNNFLKFIIAIVVSKLAGVIGARFTASAVQSDWYTALIKSPFNPPAWVFGPVWTTIYFLIGVALYLVWKQNWKITNPLLTGNRKAWFGPTHHRWNPWSERLWTGDRQKFNLIAIFVVQYVFNVAWPLVFFNWRQVDIALFVILSLWFAILYTVINFYRVSKLAAWLLVPYLFWVGFAVYLNWTIFVFN